MNMRHFAATLEQPAEQSEWFINEVESMVEAHYLDRFENGDAQEFIADCLDPSDVAPLLMNLWLDSNADSHMQLDKLMSDLRDRYITMQKATDPDDAYGMMRAELRDLQ